MFRQYARMMIHPSHTLHELCCVGLHEWLILCEDLGLTEPQKPEQMQISEEEVPAGAFSGAGPSWPTASAPAAPLPSCSAASTPALPGSELLLGKLSWRLRS